MDTRSNFGADKILCVELDFTVLETRCAVLKYSGYDATPATPQVAEITLRSQKFDLIVLSGLREFEQHQIITLSDGAEVLVLEEFTMPSELLSLVAQRLDRQQSKTQRGLVGYRATRFNRRREERTDRTRTAGNSAAVRRSPEATG
jgi:hypothetical protein